MEKEKDKPVGMFSLKKQIFVFLAVFIVVILILMGIFLTVMIGNFQKKQKQSRLTDLEKYAEVLDGSIRQLGDAVGSIYSVSSSFQGISSYQTIPEKCGYIQDLLSVLQVQVQSNHYLGGLFVHYDYGEGVLYYVNERIPYSDTRLLWNLGKSYLEGSRNSNGLGGTTADSYRKMVQEAENDLYYSVFLKRGSAMASGIVSLKQGVPVQREAMATYGIIYEGDFYRTDGEESSLSRAECAALKPGQNRVGHSLVYIHELNEDNMMVAEVIPRNIWMYVQPWHIALMVLMVCLTVWLLLLYRFIYRQLTVPLEDMSRTLREIRQGDWEVHFTASNRITEIEGVRQTVQLMLKEIGQYKIRTYEEQLARQKTQLQFLQLQLAPHFYTNCLKNIYYMLMMKEYENAEQFLLRLSKHLRYLLQRDTTLVTVTTEKEFVENYISLQELLSSRSVGCIISVDQEVEDEEIPILAIQTFVENSIKYTEVNKDRQLIIHVQVNLVKTGEGEQLNIRVRDNGPGYPVSMLAALNRKRDLLANKDFGVGILNLLCRLRIHYGEEADWFFDNREGAFSELILPVYREKEIELRK